MTLDIPLYRLNNQRLSRTEFSTAADVVSGLGAIQSQDFAGGKWAIGLRTGGLTDEDVESAFANGSILRTHLMRPTWHFVTPNDIRWLLALTAPHVRADLAYMDRQLELDTPTLSRSNKMIIKILQGGKQMTRADLGTVLQRGGINTDDLRLGQIIMHAELDGVVCSGARQGKQFTYALLEERVPPSKDLEREEALAELARRYFTSHGPATLKDFLWWSGLPAADAKSALDMVRSTLENELINGETYWFVGNIERTKSRRTKAYLLPNYDEYTVGYTDRSAIINPADLGKFGARASVLAQNIILGTGQVVAAWKRTVKKTSVIIETQVFRDLRKSEMKAIIEAAERYAMFLNLPFSIVFADTE